MYTGTNFKLDTTIIMNLREILINDCGMDFSASKKVKIECEIFANEIITVSYSFSS